MEHNRQFFHCLANKTAMFVCTSFTNRKADFLEEKNYTETQAPGTPPHTMFMLVCNAGSNVIV